MPDRPSLSPTGDPVIVSEPDGYRLSAPGSWGGKWLDTAFFEQPLQREAATSCGLIPPIDNRLRPLHRFSGSSIRLYEPGGVYPRRSRYQRSWGRSIFRAQQLILFLGFAYAEDQLHTVCVVSLIQSPPTERWIRS